MIFYLIRGLGIAILRHNLDFSLCEGKSLFILVLGRRNPYLIGALESEFRKKDLSEACLQEGEGCGQKWNFASQSFQYFFKLLVEQRASIGRACLVDIMCGGGGGGGWSYSSKFTLSYSKVCDFPYPIAHLTKKYYPISELKKLVKYLMDGLMYSRTASVCGASNFLKIKELLHDIFRSL